MKIKKQKERLTLFDQSRPLTARQKLIEMALNGEVNHKLADIAIKGLKDEGQEHIGNTRLAIAAHNAGIDSIDITPNLQQLPKA